MKQQDISRNILPMTATILEAMHRLNEDVGGVIFLVDAAGRMQGLMTDGDIRRALLNGSAINAKVDSLMTRKFTFATPEMSDTECLKLLSTRVRHVPILDDGKPINMVSWGELWHLPVTEPSLGGNEMKYVADCIDTVWISSQGGGASNVWENRAPFRDSAPDRRPSSRAP